MNGVKVYFRQQCCNRLSWRKISRKRNAFYGCVIDAIPNISIISKIEVLSYIAAEKEYEILRNFCADALIIDLDDEIVIRPSI